jgi:hypothetical protein
MTPPVHPYPIRAFPTIPIVQGEALGLRDLNMINKITIFL